MNTLHFSIIIHTTKEVVWDTMLGATTYSKWTKPFSEDSSSFYEGDWSEGSKILFLAKDSEGTILGGMISHIEKNIPYHYISIKHLGMIENGIEQLLSEDAIGFENYTLTDIDGGVQVDVDMINIPEAYKETLREMWPKALVALKELCEK